MPLIRTEVAGDPVKLFVLPPFDRKFRLKFDQFVVSEKILGLDVETTATDEEAGLFDPSQRMRMIQFGSKDAAWCFDPDSEWKHTIRWLLERRDRRFVSHMNYDPLWIRRDFDIDLA